MAMVSLAGVWGYVTGAVLFGGMAAFLWKDEAVARADARAAGQQAGARLREVPPPGQHGSSWS